MWFFWGWAMTDFSQASVEDRLAIASNNAATADELRSLAKDGDRAVRAATAGNPNTPTEVLLKLGEEFPDEITANPIFNILLLEDPESQFVRLSLARSSTTSEETIARLAEMVDEEILCAVAQNNRTPLYVLEQLVYYPPKLYEDSLPDDFDRLFVCIARNPNTTESLLLDLSEYGSSISYAIAENPNAPIDLLEKFSDRNNPHVWKALVKNPNTSAAILEKVAGWDSEEVRQALRAHPNVSKEAIAIADFMEGIWISSVELLEKLADDPRDHLRLRVANYKFTPDHVLRKLLKNLDKLSNIEVFKAVSLHHNISVGTLEHLIATVKKTAKRNFLYNEAQRLLGHPND
jgi:hypothetical protein